MGGAPLPPDSRPGLRRRAAGLSDLSAIVPACSAFHSIAYQFVPIRGVVAIMRTPSRHDDRRRRRRRPGMTLVWGIITFTALMAVVSLAVDLGRVQLARTELQQAADAAARYAAAGFPRGVSAAQDNALAAAAENRVLGKPVALVREEDVEFGAWDAAARTFTPYAGSARAGAGA